MTADEIEEAKAILAQNPDRVTVELTSRLLAEVITTRQAVARMAVPLEAMRGSTWGFGWVIGRDLRAAIVEATEVGREIVHDRMPVSMAGQRDVPDDPASAQRLTRRSWVPSMRIWMPYPPDIASAAVITVILAAFGLLGLLTG